jgi:tRNA pseudouridine38-40 synthase
MRYFLILSYDGGAYHGWQSQPNAVSVQECVEKALRTLLRVPVPIVGAGRTDTGVHARHMTAHFDVNILLDTAQMTGKLNRLLPDDIAVLDIRQVREDAHARFDACSRTYEYHIVTAKEVFKRDYAMRLFHAPDFAAMNAAAKCLCSYTDFTSFSKVHTDVKTNNCRITHAAWTQLAPHHWVFTITADRFLRNMVRAIVGTLLEVGRGKMTQEGFCRVIEQKDRCSAGTSVPAQGLFLVDVGYPESVFVLPSSKDDTLIPRLPHGQ